VEEKEEEEEEEEVCLLALCFKLNGNQCVTHIFTVESQQVAEVAGPLAHLSRHVPMPLKLSTIKIRSSLF
jgi:hypothetical protein